MNTQQVKAHVKTQRISPRKARLVADLIRNKSTSEALSVLNNSPKKAARIFLKLLNSAIANAINNHGLDSTKLRIAQVYVNEGPTLKRFQPRSQGRAYAILKRTSNFSIFLEESALGSKEK